MIISVTEFKAKCLSILEHVRTTGEAVTLTKRGAVIAEVRSTAHPRGDRNADPLQGSVKILGDVLAPVLPPAAWEVEGARSIRKLASRTLRLKRPGTLSPSDKR